MVVCIYRAIASVHVSVAHSGFWMQFNAPLGLRRNFREKFTCVALRNLRRRLSNYDKP